MGTLRCFAPPVPLPLVSVGMVGLVGLEPSMTLVASVGLVGCVGLELSVGLVGCVVVVSCGVVCVPCAESGRQILKRALIFLERDLHRLQIRPNVAPCQVGPGPKSIGKEPEE